MDGQQQNFHCKLGSQFVIEARCDFCEAFDVGIQIFLAIIE
jgi:hypothetical protein